MASYERTCEHCGATFQAKRPQAKYDRPACRVAATRLRAELRPDPPAAPASSSAPTDPPPTTAPRQVLEPTAVWGAEEDPPADSSWGDGDEPRLITVLTTTHKLLSDQHVLETPFGQTALQLAARIDNCQHESGAALSALARQLAQTLRDATSATAAAEDPMDEIRRRREERRAG